jgi:hypothetical protein
MNRRDFTKLTGLAIVGGPALLSLEGCPTVASVVAAVETVLKESEAILTSAGQTAWSSRLNDAYVALQAAYAAWDHSTTTTTGQKIDALLNALVAATNAVLPDDPYAALIDELVALAELAIGFFGAKPTANVATVPNPHVGAVPEPKSGADSKRRFNAIVAANPALAKAAL